MKLEWLSSVEGRTIVAILMIAAAFSLRIFQQEWARDMFVFGMALLAREMGMKNGTREDH